MTQGKALEHTRYEVLDGMRGIAAFAVVIFHYGGLPFYPVNAFIAVDLFFILSGFVLAHSYGQKLLSGKMTARDFICRRLIRLYPMFLMGLIIGVPAFYALTQSGFYTYPAQDITMSALCNLFFLPYFGGDFSHHSVEDIFPVNYPAWSLFFELFANLFCLVLFRFTDGTLKKLVAVSYILLIVGGAYKTGINIDLGGHVQSFWYGFPRVFYGFIFGILLYRLTDRKIIPETLYRRLHIARNPFILYAFLVAVFMFPLQIRGLYAAFITGIIFLVIILVGATTSCKTAFGLSVSRFLGWISYPLYCLHIPVQRIAWVLCGKFHFNYNVPVTASTAVIASIILCRFCEEPVRRYLTNKLRYTAVNSPRKP